MAENETNKPAIKQPENPIKLGIERNSKVIEFKEARTTRGQNPGKMTFDPNIEDKQAFLEWVGLDNVVGIVRGKVRTLALGWAQEALDDDTGQFIENKFVKFATDFSSTGETIGELEDQFEDYRDELVKLNLTDPASQAPFLELGKKMQDLTIAINSKKRTRTPKTEAVAA